MEPIHPSARGVLASLRADLAGLFGPTLMGLYLYGSAVWGDFTPGISDLDMLAVLPHDMDDAVLERLHSLHAALVCRYPEWDDRIEVQYLPVDALSSFRERPSPMVNLSPGEPLHRNIADIQWLANWYFVQEYGLILHGPDPRPWIEPMITQDEFIRAVFDHALSWREHIEAAERSRGYQGYAVLTLCRALSTLTFKRQVSKQQAAAWAVGQYPEYALMIENALDWRQRGQEPGDPSDTYPMVRACVLSMIEQCEALYVPTS